MTPDHLLYTAEHEWLLRQEESFRVGITDFAQEALGDIVYVQLPSVGATLTAGAACGEVESTKSVSEIYAPLSGRVIAVNEALSSNPEVINSDPYGAGWLFDLASDDEVGSLLSAEAYRAATGG